MSSAVAVPPVRITASTASWLTSCWPTVAPLQGTNCSAVRGTPAAQKHSQSAYAMSTVSEAGFRMTVFPAARPAATPPHGIASGKFQGETTTTTPLPRAARPGELVEESLRRVGVEAAEVDRFGNFGIALGERLASLGEHRAHQVAAAAGDFVGDAVQHCGPFARRTATPAVGIVARAARRRDRCRPSVAWR